MQSCVSCLTGLRLVALSVGSNGSPGTAGACNTSPKAVAATPVAVQTAAVVPDTPPAGKPMKVATSVFEGMPGSENDWKVVPVTSLDSKVWPASNSEVYQHLESHWQWKSLNFDTMQADILPTGPLSILEPLELNLPDEFEAKQLPFRSASAPETWLAYPPGLSPPEASPVHNQLSSPHLLNPLSESPLLPSSLPSLGSIMHGTGKCNPCAWYWKPKMCLNGQDCTFCHLCPEGELKVRRKAKIAAMRTGCLTPTAKASDAASSTRGAAPVLRLSTLL